MHELAAGKIIVNNSRFYAHLYTMETSQQIHDVIQNHTTMYAKAHHHCYALRIKDETNMVIEQVSDDGEVGRPGQILLQILQKYDYASHALVVSRIFGGIKLGVGGVSRAFRSAGEGVVQLYRQC
jgi:putative IMPACT (imprinted ancient) family translation regulator